MVYSRVAVLVATIVLALIALAGVLFVQGDDATQRLALLFGILGTGLAAFVALLKSDQAATQTNGGLDHRIQAAVHRANAARRRGDPPLTPEQVDALTYGGEDALLPAQAGAVADGD